MSHHQWHDDYAEVCRLGRWLLEERNFTGAELYRFFEKPHNWSAQYREMIEEERHAGNLAARR